MIKKNKFGTRVDEGRGDGLKKNNRFPEIESHDTRNFQLNLTKGFASILPYLFFHFTF